MPITSCPHWPYPAPVHSRLWLLVWSQSLSEPIFLFSCSLVFFPALPFPKDPAFSCYAQSRATSVLSASSNVSGFIRSRAHVLIFLAVYGIHRAHLQHLISDGSIFFLFWAHVAYLMHDLQTSSPRYGLYSTFLVVSAV